MSKRKNLDPWGGASGGHAPLNPPMIITYQDQWRCTQAQVEGYLSPVYSDIGLDEDFIQHLPHFKIRNEKREHFKTNFKSNLKPRLFTVSSLFPIGYQWSHGLQG